MSSSRERPPEPGNRFRLRLRCVRACVRAKLRERCVSSVARVGWTDLWGGVQAAFSCKSVCYASKTLAKRLSRSPRLGGLMLPEIPCVSEDLGFAGGHADPRCRWSRWSPGAVRFAGPCET